MRRAIPALLIILFTSQAVAQEFSGLILTENGIERIQANRGEAPLFERSLETIKHQVDAEIENGFDVPVPKDLAGGYTHGSKETI